jgi:hypothetical protein
MDLVLLGRMVASSCEQWSRSLSDRRGVGRMWGKREAFSTRTLCCLEGRWRQASTSGIVFVPFKLLYDTRWNHEKLSDADTTLASSNKPWLEVLQELNNTAIPVLEGRRIALFYTWKVRAIIASTGARDVCQTEVVILTREEEGAERQKKAMDLVRFNSRSTPNFELDALSF